VKLAVDVIDRFPVAILFEDVGDVNWVVEIPELALEVVFLYMLEFEAIEVKLDEAEDTNDVADARDDVVALDV
jgi:hypothetical protein